MSGPTQYNYLGVSPIGFKVGAGGVTKDTLVKLDSSVTGSPTVVVAAAITDEVVGVALTTQAAGEVVAVQSYGIARCVASAAIATGAKVMFATGAKVATANGATAKIVGVALEDAATDGDVIPVLLKGGVCFQALGA